MEQARAMAKEAIELYLEDMAADNEKIPETDSTLVGTIEVVVA
jgi:predicted RNase H-like HicB family nuclease